MVFGLFNPSSTSNIETVQACFLAKGVKKKEHIFSTDNLGLLIEKVNLYDTVVVISVVNAFPSVNALLQAFTYFKNKGVTFLSVNEKYLTFKDGKELKFEYVNYMSNLAYDENNMISSIYSIYKTINLKEIECRIKILYLRTLARTFSNDGVLKRR